jgi:hypothetical protein
MVITVPNFFSSIYAEDGQIYLQDALDTGGLHNLFKTVAGYGDLPARAIAAVVSLFPVSLYPYAYGLFSGFVMLICTTLVYSSVAPIFQNRSLSLLFSSFLLILPIARFESIGNVTNLHFFFFTASTFVFIHFLCVKKSTYGQLFFVFVSALSVPLCVFLFIFMLYRWRENSIYIKNPRMILNSPFFYLLIGSLLNLVISWGDTVARAPRNTNSFLKISYLYFDRVVGSSFVPFWGRVSSDGNQILVSHTPITSLAIRMVISTLLMGVLIFLVTRLDRNNRSIANFVIMSSLLYSFLIGYFYNLEPRYCIFPAYGLVFSFFMYLSSLEKRAISFYIGGLMLLLILNSSSETESRKNSLDWKTQVALASTACQSATSKTQIPIRIAPFRPESNWTLRISCDRLAKR